MPSNCSEFEVKLLFPKDRLKAIEKFIVAKGGIRRQRLQAAYIDTPNFLLTQAGIAFRLRKEGSQWVQTLKVSTPNPLERLEHNVVLEAVGSAIPKWMPELHKNHESGRLLYKRFPKLRSEDLQICYQTDIWRRKAFVSNHQGVIEYALDIGFIYTNLVNGVAKTIVQELEIELKEGDPLNVLRHARDMIKIHKAYIDTRSKSERGFLLACGLQFSPPVKAKSVSIRGVKAQTEIIHLLMNSCLSQVLSNQSVLNADFDQYSEYLHQLRIGLRRLKVLLKYLARQNILISDEGGEVFKRTFDKLGQYRDNHYIVSVLNPILLSLGDLEIRLASIKELPNPALITRDKDFQLLLIELMMMGVSKTATSTKYTESKNSKKGAGDFKKTVVKLLDSGFQFIESRIVRFAILDDEGIHAIRKKMKFVRYSLEFFKEYCSQDKYAKFFKEITAALECFGMFNDVCVAISRIDGLAQDDPSLLHALNWLKIERQRLRTLCEKSAKKLVGAALPWKGRSVLALQ